MREPAAFAAAVIDWQRIHGRHDLPWQQQQPEEPDPYRVWLSEIMLQQTQVATVRDYFVRFVERFPDVAALAAAPVDDVFALWSGLGYYHRARNLHRCAQQIVAEHGGAFPRTAQVLQTLPGIGRSTAAAIAAFCFGERVAILDGNVRRVLTRVLGFAQDVGLASSQRALWDHATELLPHDDLAFTMPRYTQGLMDLGATICRTRRPACLLCPLAAQCVAQQSGNAEKYPVKSPPRARTELHWWLLIAQDARGRIWLQRRPLAGVWPGLFCPPAFDS
ncbi:MAG: A/G-specific adenine glycosylase, partial [Burkholderiales bacterium]